MSSEPSKTIPPAPAPSRDTERLAIREALTKLARSAGRMTWGPFAVIRHIEDFRDTEYPVPSAAPPETP